MLIDVKECARWLLENDEYVLVCHRDPDGDSFGSATALADALLNIGKKVKIECPTEFPENLTFLKKDYENFEAKFIVGIDTAAPNMFGDKDVRPNHIDLVIDHHPTNPDYADRTWLVNYAATGEAIFELLKEMKVNISPFAATAMFCAMSSEFFGIVLILVKCGT